MEKLRAMLVPTVLIFSACGTPPVPPAAEPIEPPPSLSADELPAMLAVVGFFSERTTGGQMVCLSFLQDRRTTRPAPAALVQEAEARWANVTTDACPRTYERMAVLADSLGRPIIEEPPPGHIDPRHLSVGRPGPAEGGTVPVEAHIRQGTRGRIYRCLVPVEPSEQPVRCRMQSTWIS